MISNTKRDGTHKTPEKCRPKATLSARSTKTHPRTIKKRSSNKNAFFPITHSNYQPSRATHTRLNLFLSDTHISLYLNLFYPRSRKIKKMPRRFSLFSLSGQLAQLTTIRLPLAESQPAPHAYGDPYMLAKKQPHKQALNNILVIKLQLHRRLCLMVKSLLWFLFLRL